MSARRLILMAALSLSFAVTGFASQVGDTPQLSSAQVEGPLKTGFNEAGATCTATGRGDEGFTPGAVCMGQAEQCGGVRTVFERVGGRYRIHFQFRGPNGRWVYGPRFLTLNSREEVGSLMVEGAALAGIGFIGANVATGGAIVVNQHTARAVLFLAPQILAVPLFEFESTLEWVQRPGADMYRGAAASRPWTAIGRERQACIADYLMGVSRLAQTVSSGGTPTAADFAAAAGRSTSGARAAAPATEGAPAADSASE